LIFASQQHNASTFSCIFHAENTAQAQLVNDKW